MKCVFCQGKNDKIILFVDDKLKKCQEVLSVRVKYKLKYSDTELPAEINNMDGYHRQCYSSFTALMAKYRNSIETDDSSNSSSLNFSSNTPVNISETSSKNITVNLNSEMTSVDASSSSSSQITSGDAEPSLNKEIISEDGALSLSNQAISGNFDSSLISEILSEDGAPSLDNQTTLGDADSSSTCDLNISETNVNSELSDTIIGDIETSQQLKNVCFFVIKIVNKLKVNNKIFIRQMTQKFMKKSVGGWRN